MPPSTWKNRIVRYEEAPPDQLLANPRNWRIHPHQQEEALDDTLRQVGWVAPIVVNETTGHVIDGHLRVAAAISRGHPSVPVAYVRLSPDEERIALATFDPLSAMAVADPAALDGLLRDTRPYAEGDGLSRLLADLQAALPVEGSLEGLLGDQSVEGDHGLPSRSPLSEEQADALDESHRGLLEAPPDKLAELAQRWGTAPGQKWTIPSGSMPGDAHKLCILDSTQPKTVATALNGSQDRGAKAPVIVTSPPYGVGQSYEGGDSAQQGPNGVYQPAEQQIGEWHRLISDFTAAWADRVPVAAINLADIVVAPTAGRELHTYGMLTNLCAAARWPLIATRIWKKDPVWAGTGPYWLNSYKPVHEFEYVGLFGDLERYPLKKVGDRVPEEEAWRFRGVWEMRSVTSQNTTEGKHPAAFPAELPRRCVLLLTDPGQLVVDPFAGSGTVGVVAEALSRRSALVERDPKYAALILERFTKLGLSPRKVE